MTGAGGGGRPPEPRARRAAASPALAARGRRLLPPAGGGGVRRCAGGGRPRRGLRARPGKGALGLSQAALRPPARTRCIRISVIEGEIKKSLLAPRLLISGQGVIAGWCGEGGCLWAAACEGRTRCRVNEVPRNSDISGQVVFQGSYFLTSSVCDYYLCTHRYI